MIGDLIGYGTVWYHPKAIANMLSLARVTDKARVTFESANVNQFLVHRDDGSTIAFGQSPMGLYYTIGTPNAFNFVTTVNDVKSKFSAREFEQATCARKIQRMIGRPSTRAFINIVEGNQLPNCPITRRDILNAEMLFGPDVGSLKGKTVRRPGEHVEVHTVPLPPDLLPIISEVTLCCDLMFINKMPFFVTISRGIKFGTVEMLPNQQAPTILHALKRVVSIYTRRNIKVMQAHMDGQFEVLQQHLQELAINLNIVSEAEHV
jgi:hypothetical protein